jgi:undecaprenyl-diphosphatase
LYKPDFPMPSGYVWQYEFIRWLQSMCTPTMDQYMKWLSMLGVESFYVVVLPILFWSINKRMGLRIAYVFLTSMYANAWLKEAIGVVRPVGIPGIRSLYVESATSAYSLPSGHAQGPMTFWLMIGKWIRKKWLWPFLILLVFAIGCSRLFLGLHWPLDVLVGWGLGLVFGLAGWSMGKWWTYREYAFNIRLALAVAIPVALLLVHRGSTAAEYAALLLGLGVGAVLESEYVCVDIDPAWWKRICTAVIGIAGMIALKWVIKWSSDSTVWLVVRDTLIGLWATLGAPYVFHKCGLYRRGEPVA